MTDGKTANEIGQGLHSDDAQIVDLSVSRERIDAIDEQIVQLFCERMGIVGDVAAYKRATKKPVYDPERERQKIEVVTKLAPEQFRAYMEPLFERLMELSRDYQDYVLVSVDADSEDCH